MSAEDKPDPMAGAGEEDTRTQRQRMFELSKELNGLLAGQLRDDDLIRAKDIALALSLYLEEQAR